MHSTSIILFLQKIQSPFLNYIMNYITLIGYELGVTIILSIFLFGFSFHKGFFVLQSSFLTFVTTDILKNSFATLRPFLVNSKVINLDKTMIEEVAKGSVSYSFPSGHSSGITAVLTSISLTLRKKLFYIIFSIVIFLVMFSRLYLGVHFLQDVLAGFFLAFCITLIYYVPLKDNINNNKNFPFNLILVKNGQLAFVFFFILIPFLIIFIPINFDRGQIGFLLGANFGYFLLGINFKNSYIEYKVKFLPIILRISIGFALYMILRFGLSFLFKTIFPANLHDAIYFRVIRYFLTGFLTLQLSVIIFLKTKLAYRVD